MKLFGIFATLALAQDAADNSVTISVSGQYNQTSCEFEK